MKFLCIDTTTAALFVGVYNNGFKQSECFDDGGFVHSRNLISVVDNVLSKSGLSVGDMDFIAACIGPGSFTGIRIGVTAVRALCQTCDKPAFAVNSLYLRAYNVINTIKNKVVVPVIPCVRDIVYYCGYQGKEEVIAPSVCRIEELGREIKWAKP